MVSRPKGRASKHHGGPFVFMARIIFYEAVHGEIPPPIGNPEGKTSPNWGKRKLGHEGKAALLGGLLTVLLAPYDDLNAFSGRIRVSVPRMGVGEASATTLAMVVRDCRRPL